MIYNHTMSAGVFGAIIGGTSMFGILTNAYAMFVLYHGGKIKFSFQQICFSVCFSNFFELVFFLLYCCPVTIFQLHDFTQNSWIAKIIVAIMSLLWNVAVFSHLSISINRMMVITWPVQSRHFINQAVTTAMILTVWGIGLLNFLPYLYVPLCYMTFDTTLYFFTFPSNTCGSILGDIQYWGLTSCSALVLIFDSWTLIRLISYRMSKGSSIHTHDIRFFFQAVLQGLLFINALFFFYVISSLFSNPADPNYTVVFFTNTFMWIITQSMDGLIIALFHMKDYRKKHGESSSTGQMRIFQQSTPRKPSNTN